MFLNFQVDKSATDRPPSDDMANVGGMDAMAVSLAKALAERGKAIQGLCY